MKNTKKTIEAIFKAEILPGIIRTYGKDDKPAIREAWNNFCDYLHKDGQISDWQVNNWTHPNFCN